jgi:hypothetical protein
MANNRDVIKKIAFVPLHYTVMITVRAFHFTSHGENPTYKYKNFLIKRIQVIVSLNGISLPLHHSTLWKADLRGPNENFQGNIGVRAWKSSGNGSQSKA